MTSRPPVALFDLDGTLVDTAPDLTASLNEALRAGSAEQVEVSHVKNMIGRGARKLIERGMELSGQTPDETELDYLIDIFLTHYRKNMANHSAFFPGADRFMDMLTANGVALAICTNKREEMAVALMAELGMKDRFELIAGVDTHPVNKPDPGHLTLTVEQIGGDPERVIMLGDSFADVEAARRAGYPCIGVSFGYTDTPMRELEPDIVIDHYDEAWPHARRMLALD